VLDEAPDVPPALVSTLLGFARHADQDGQRSYPSVETLMRYTRKRERQVRDDIKELRKRGLLIVSVDQSAAAHIRADRRPTVYELPMHQRRDDATGCGTPQVVDNAPDAARGAPDCTPSDSRGAPQRSTGCAPASNGVRHSAPEEDRTNLLRKESAARASSSSSRSRREDDDEARERKIQERKRRERVTARREIMRRRPDVDQETADALLDHLVENYNAGMLDAYIDGLNDSDLADRLDEVAWQVEERREVRENLTRDVVAWAVETHPGIEATVLGRFGLTYKRALRRGHDPGTLADAITEARSKPSQGDLIAAYINAINALGQPVAA
jgi:hypothetical protein